MSKKKSEFIGVGSVPSSYQFNCFVAGVDRRIPKEDLFQQIKDESFAPFIYPTIELLQDADLEADDTNPTYVRCEETEYRLYKITNLAAGVGDIALDNGNTATKQIEYRDIGYITTPGGVVGSIPVFTGTTEIDDLLTPSNAGKAFMQADDSASVTYARKNADNTVTMRTASQHFDDIKQVSSAGYSGTIETATATTAKAGVATDEAITPALFKDAVVFETVSDIALVSKAVGTRSTTKGCQSAGDGGHGIFITEAASGTPDGYGRVLLPNGNHDVLQLVNGAVNILQFGAIGDGVTDCSDAYDRAQEYCKNVIVPAGDFLFVGDDAEQAFLPSNFQLTGVGRETNLIYQPTGASYRAFFNPGGDNITIKDLKITVDDSFGGSLAIFTHKHDNITFKNVEFDGGITGARGSASHIVYVCNNSGSGSRRGLYFYNCTIHHCSRLILQSNASTATTYDHKVINCEFYSNYSADCSFNTPNGENEDILIDGCSFRDSMSTLSTGGHYVGFAGVKKARVLGNYFEGELDNPIHIEEDSDDVIIDGNQINCDVVGSFGCISVQDNDIGGVADQPTRVIISNNIMVKTGTTKEATSVGINVIYDGTSATPSKNIIISNNFASGFADGYKLGGVMGDSSDIFGNVADACTNGFRFEFLSESIRMNTSSNCDVGIYASHSGVADGHKFINCTLPVDVTSRRLLLINPIFEFPVFTSNAGSTLQKLVIPLGANERAAGESIAFFTSNTAVDMSQRQDIIAWDGATLSQTARYSIGGGAASLTISISGGSLSVGVFTTSARTNCQLVYKLIGSIVIS